jgi:hypothetical protein
MYFAGRYALINKLTAGGKKQLAPEESRWQAVAVSSQFVC